MDISKAFSVDNGFLVDEENGGPFYTGGVASPIGLDLPTQTLYVQPTVDGPIIWRKFGTGVNDWRQLSAEDIPADNSVSLLEGEDVQAQLDELATSVAVSASPGFSFGKGGNLSSGAWLARPGGVPSNITGIPVGLLEPKIVRISVGSQNANTYNIGIYEHEGDSVNLTLLTTVSIVASRTEVFEVDVSITSGRQLAARVTSGSVKNPGVDLQLSGSTMT